jgi:hypothetical protein
MIDISRLLVWEMIFAVPAVVTFAILVMIKLARDREARLPFTRLPLRAPGESARRKADEIFESFSLDLGLLCFAWPATGFVLGLVQHGELKLAAAIGLIVSIAGAGIIGTRMASKLRTYADYRIGSLGEQVVGRELDQLMAQGYRVFHDVEFEGWNIDHVVVGPRGVFAVETKTRRKPSKRSGLEAKVVFDGETLTYPGKSHERDAIEQASRNAESLAKWIAESAAENIPVVPVIALPGWALDIRRYGPVAVYSATDMGEPMLKRGKTQLNPGQIERITHQLRRVCEVESTGSPKST